MMAEAEKEMGFDPETAEEGAGFFDMIDQFT